MEGEAGRERVSFWGKVLCWLNLHDGRWQYSRRTLSARLVCQRCNKVTWQSEDDDGRGYDHYQPGGGGIW